MKLVSTSMCSRSAFSTAVIAGPVTWVEYGLTMRSARFTLATSMPRTALIVAIPEAEPRSARFGSPTTGRRRSACPRTSRSSFRSPTERGRRARARGARRGFRRVRLRARPRRAVRRRARLAASGAVGAVRDADRGGLAALAGLPAVRGHARRGDPAPDRERHPVEVDVPLPIAARAREVTLIEEARRPSAGRAPGLSTRRLMKRSREAGPRPASRFLRPRDPYGSRKSIAGVLSSV